LRLDGRVIATTVQVDRLPVAAPGRKPVSEKQLRNCLQNIPLEWLQAPRRKESEIRQRVEQEIGGTILVPRSQLREALKARAGKQARKRGRPRKNSSSK
jgi:hypothetical protein